MLTVGSLFAGIGGFDLAARWMGWRTIWVSEIDPYASRVLAKHFPDAPNLGDITTIDWSQHERPDIICGGFPCQDISNAGKRAGITGARSGLWKEYARAIRDLQPGYVVVENVGALLVRGLDVVLSDLAAIGYNAEWDVLSAADVGAPHLRERLWILAYPTSTRRQRSWCRDERLNVAAAPKGRLRHQLGRMDPNQYSELVADPNQSRPQGQRRSTVAVLEEQPNPASGSRWLTEPNVGRVAHGVPARVDRLRGLGNAIVPQCAIAGPFQRIAELKALASSRPT